MCGLKLISLVSLLLSFTTHYSLLTSRLCFQELNEEELRKNTFSREDLGDKSKEVGHSWSTRTELNGS